MVCAVPRTSTCRTCNRPSLTSFRPFKMFSLVWSRSFRAVATTGTLVVWRSRRASSRPMPREAGVTRAHGCIAHVIAFEYSEEESIVCATILSILKLFIDDSSRRSKREIEFTDRTSQRDGPPIYRTHTTHTKATWLLIVDIDSRSWSSMLEQTSRSYC